MSARILPPHPYRDKTEKPLSLHAATSRLFPIPPRVSRLVNDGGRLVLQADRVGREPGDYASTVSHALSVR